jgi:hypothetical protein
MRKFTLPAACAVILLLAPAGARSSASPSTDAFVGGWTSTDLDGSHQELSIRGSGQGTHAVSLFDDAASVACDGSAAHFQGTGDAEGNSLTVTGTLTCQPGGNPLAGRIAIGFSYSPGTDTLTDESGVVWARS